MSDTDPSPPPASIDIVEERLAVGKEVHETGAVRVRIEVGQRDEPLTLERVADEVVVERVEIGRVVDQRREPWHDGDVTVVPVYVEVAVVERRLMLVEEIRLRRQTTRTSQIRTVPLLQQRAIVERRQPDGSWVEVDPDA